MNNARLNPFKPVYLLWWILSNIIGWVIPGIVIIGFSASNFAIVTSPASIADFFLIAIGGWIFGGIVISMTQWLILRRNGKNIIWWIPVTLLSWIAAGAINELVKGFIGGCIIGKAVAWGIAGAVVGFAQWLVIQKQLRKSSWWILSNSIGWIIGGILSEFVAAFVNIAAYQVFGIKMAMTFHGQASSVGSGAGMLIEGIFIGLLTGALLLRLWEKTSSAT
jgi:hypothetical protein